jgi:hypothetical protein
MTLSIATAGLSFVFKQGRGGPFGVNQIWILKVVCVLAASFTLHATSEYKYS